jgi:hypothetical protein
MGDDDRASRNVAGELSEILVRIAAPAGRPITGTTELYYDLGLAGDDLYEAIAAVRARFGTDFSAMDLTAYAPGETEALFSLDLLREFLGRPRRYRSLTVDHLAQAVEAGAWKVS